MEFNLLDDVLHLCLCVSERVLGVHVLGGVQVKHLRVLLHGINQVPHTFHSFPPASDAFHASLHHMIFSRSVILNLVYLVAEQLHLRADLLGVNLDVDPRFLLGLGLLRRRRRRWRGARGSTSSSCDGSTSRDLLGRGRSRDTVVKVQHLRVVGKYVVRTSGFDILLQLSKSLSFFSVQEPSGLILTESVHSIVVGLLHFFQPGNFVSS